MKIVLAVVCIYMCAMLFALGVPHVSDESFVRNRVVMLTSKVGECTGVQVRGFHTNNVYILTAGHCDMLFSSPVKAVMEDGESAIVYPIVEDTNSDLLLVSPVNSSSLKIGRTPGLYDDIYTITHGAEKPAFKTTGEILDQEEVKVGVEPILDQASEDKCSSMPKFKVYADGFGNKICILDKEENVSTAWITPGSSGGPLLDKYDDVVGIASAAGDGFSFWVTVQDIRAFLSDK